MNRLFRRFWPPFFEQIDHWLLLNHPRLWATRIHGLLLALSGFGILIAVKLLMTSYQHVPNTEVDFTVIVIVSVLIWLGWMVSMYAFRPGKYTSELPGGGQYSLVLMLGTFLVASMPLFYGLGISAKLDIEGNYSYWQEEKLLDYGESYWTYDIQSLENSRYYFNHNRNKFGSNSLQSEQEKLEAAMRLMEKYGGDLHGATSQDLLAAYQHEIALPHGFAYEIENVRKNLRHRREAIYLFDGIQDFPAFRADITHFIIFSFLLIGLLTIIFQHASLKQFVWAVVAFGVVSITVGLIVFLNELSRFMRGDNLLSFLILSSYILVAMVAFGGKQRFKSLQKTALILLALALPFFGLVLGFLGEEVLDISINYDWGLVKSYQKIFGLGVIPAILSFVLWITIFIPRLQKLQTNPPRK